MLGGAPHHAGSDVYSVGVLAWELCAGRAMRPRLRGEDLGAYAARWQDRPAPPLPPEVAVPPGVPELPAAALALDPAARPDTMGLATLLGDALSGAVERSSRHARGDTLLAGAREILGRYRALGQRLEDERRVVAIQQARVPGHAPEAAKRALWEAEDRLSAIEDQRGLIWLDAVHEALLAGALGPADTVARDMVAELWWVRMEAEAARGHSREVALAAYEVQKFDPERRGAVLRAPCRLRLVAQGVDGPARVEIARLEAERRRLRPVVLEQRDLPVEDLALPPGRYLFTVTAPDRAPAVLPLCLERAESLDLSVRLYRPEELGQGWCLVPAGPFLLGGDPVARQPLPRCRPTLGDFFLRQHLVTSAEWQAFLDALPPEEALRRAPSGLGPAGLRSPWWTPQEGRWPLPPGWDPRWPIVGIDAEDATAFAAWVSERDGRPQRLPTEEEGEKAARGGRRPDLALGRRARPHLRPHAGLAPRSAGPGPRRCLPHRPLRLRLPGHGGPGSRVDGLLDGWRPGRGARRLLGRRGRAPALRRPGRPPRGLARPGRRLPPGQRRPGAGLVRATRNSYRVRISPLSHGLRARSARRGGARRMASKGGASPPLRSREGYDPARGQRVENQHGDDVRYAPEARAPVRRGEGGRDSACGGRHPPPAGRAP